MWQFSTRKSVFKQRVTHNKMMAIRLYSAVDAQTKYDNVRKKFFTRKRISKTLGKVILISQDIRFQFLKEM